MARTYVFSFLIAIFFTSAHGATAVHTSASADTPSPEAIKACSDKISGDVCSFTNKEGTRVNGKCANTQSNAQGKTYCAPIK